MRILTSAEMAAVDRAATRRTRIPSLLLMERAAEGIVRLAREVAPWMRRATILCGPGNNGGDGLAAARLLARHGVPSRLVTLSPPARLRGDARAQWEALRAEGREAVDASRSFAAALAAISGADLLIDALFGTGLSRPLSGVARRLVGAANGSGVPILSVDVPSGISGDSGAAPGAVIAAHWTGAIAALKRCHVLEPARSLCGEIAVIDIGIPDGLLETRRHRFAMIGWEAIAPLFPPRARDSHKGDFGHVLVVAGSRGKAGAALLCAAGALRSGAGLVTIACPESIEARYLSALPEAMTLPLAEESGAFSSKAAAMLGALLPGFDAAVVGPGMGTGPGAAAVLAAVRRSALPALFDADALNLHPGRPEALRRRAATILTPHPGEAARLLGKTIREVQEDRPAAAEALARRSGATVILKGEATLVASRGGHLWCNSTGSPALAKGGTGDVLAGVGAGFLGQGLEPVDAAVAAAFVHGLAGEHAERASGERGVLASEVAGRIGPVLREFERAGA